MAAFSEAGLRDRIGIALFACTLSLAPASTSAQDVPRMVDCAFVEGANPSNVTPAVRHRVGFANERVARAVLTLASRPEPTIAEFLPLRERLSYRSALFEAPANSGAWLSAFDLATIEAAGTALLETWTRYSTLPNEAARYSYMRLRCPSTG